MSTPAPATSIRLSAQLKSLLSSSIGHAPSSSQAQLESLFDSIRLQSEEQYVHINSSSTEGGERPENGQKGVGKRKTAEIWLIVITGALFALNALEAIPHLYAYAVGCYTSALDTCTLRDGGGKVGETEDEGKAAALWVASRMREVGLKSTSFMGVPRAINCLATLHEAVKTQTPEIVAKLPTRSRRDMTAASLSDFQMRGKKLWDDIYAPHNEKLLAKLGDFHPDLPTHILTCHYSALLAPVGPEDLLPTDLNRVESSVLAVACLRALGGVGKQVESHVFGLRKASGDDIEGWITSDEGCVWLLDAVDMVVELFRSP